MSWYSSDFYAIFCSNIIFLEVLNIASGINQNNYLCKDDVKPLAIPGKKKVLQPARE